MASSPKFPTPITKAVRKAVFEAWNDCCAYCDTAPAEHVDHIFPKSKGGPDALENFAAACASCNLKKSDLMLGEGYLAIIQAKAARKAPRISLKLSREKKKAEDLRSQSSKGAFRNSTRDPVGSASPESRKIYVSVPVPVRSRGALIKKLEGYREEPPQATLNSERTSDDRKSERKSTQAIKIRCDKHEDPDLFDWMSGCFESGVPKVRGRLFSTTLVQDVEVCSNELEAIVKPELLDYLRIAEELKAFSFEFTASHRNERLSIGECKLLKEDDSLDLALPSPGM